MKTLSLLSCTLLLSIATAQDNLSRKYLRRDGGANNWAAQHSNLRLTIDLTSSPRRSRPQSIISKQNTVLVTKKPAPAVPVEPVLDVPDDTDTAACPSGPDIDYKATSADDCARVRFFCEEGFEYFGAGDCGCGCQPAVLLEIQSDEPGDPAEPELDEPDARCPGGPGIDYVANSADDCAVVRFFCEPGLQYFSAGDCGCGCEPVSCVVGGGATTCPDGFVCEVVSSDDEECNPADESCPGKCLTNNNV